MLNKLMSALVLVLALVVCPNLFAQPAVFVQISVGQWCYGGDCLGKVKLYQNVMGTGPAYVVSLTEGGKLSEVYHNWCLRYSDNGDCQEVDPAFVVRSRTVEPWTDIQVIRGADLYLNGNLIMEIGDRFFERIAPEEISDPKWQPKAVGRTFKSVIELRKYAKETRHWLVIGSPAAAHLFGYMYNVPVLKLLASGREFLVFDFAQLAEERFKEVPTSNWRPTHVKYRYLAIYWGGHDVEWGPGCISIFGFPKGADTCDAYAPRMVEFQSNKSITYYGESEPGFELNEVQ